MKSKKFNLNANISIEYNNEILMGPLHYRLLNHITTDNMLNKIHDQLNISRQKAISLINNMNRHAPYAVIEIEKNKKGILFHISDFGIRLLNLYAQKEFDLFMFLKKSEKNLNNNLMLVSEEKQLLVNL